MPKSINTPKTYDANDIGDAYNLAACNLEWIGALLTTIRRNTLSGDTSTNKSLLELAEYLCDDFTAQHEKLAAQYFAEFKEGQP